MQPANNPWRSVPLVILASEPEGIITICKKNTLDCCSFVRTILFCSSKILKCGKKFLHGKCLTNMYVLINKWITLWFKERNNMWFISRWLPVWPIHIPSLSVDVITESFITHVSYEMHLLQIKFRQGNQDRLIFVSNEKSRVRFKISGNVL